MLQPRQRQALEADGSHQAAGWGEVPGLSILALVKGRAGAAEHHAQPILVALLQQALPALPALPHTPRIPPAPLLGPARHQQRRRGLGRALAVDGEHAVAAGVVLPHIAQLQAGAVRVLRALSADHLAAVLQDGTVVVEPGHVRGWARHQPAVKQCGVALQHRATLQSLCEDGLAVLGVSQHRRWPASLEVRRAALLCKRRRMGYCMSRSAYRLVVKK